MRTIKFRGQRVDNGEWVYGNLIQVCNIHFMRMRHSYIVSDCKSFQVKPETVGQFTGLQDKNGVDVYEGDVIQYKNCSWHKRWWSNISEIEIIEKECEEQRKYITQFTSVVRYDDCMFKLDYPILLHDVRMNHKEITRKTNNGDSYSKYWDFEVVGNEFENPELLTKN